MSSRGRADNMIAVRRGGADERDVRGGRSTCDGIERRRCRAANAVRGVCGAHQRGHRAG